MYEQYTDKQIVEMLVPKLMKAVPEVSWDAIKANPDFHSVTNKMIATIYRSAADNGVWACQNSYLEKVTEHWVPANKDNIKAGSKVKMINEKSYRSKPWSFPDVGTVGTVTEVGSHIHLVQWPKGSTSRTDEWYCDDTLLEVLLCE